MNLQLIKDTIGWGFLLWLIGYILGFVFFFIAPPALIGWFIMPVGVALSLWVLFKRITIYIVSVLSANRGNLDAYSGCF